ncbi:MAG: hypothetical protein JRE40_04205 [Deltaproteobacteria bacterium]|nr:hypothetical protein [Deltaproteobacteria bacterium]
MFNRERFKKLLEASNEDFWLLNMLDLYATGELVPSTSEMDGLADILKCNVTDMCDVPQHAHSTPLMGAGPQLT